MWTDSSVYVGWKKIHTLIDDYTHFTMVYLLKNKHKTTETIKEYVHLVEAKWNYKISRIKSDNGREYVNNNLLNWAKARGIEMNFTFTGNEWNSRTNESNFTGKGQGTSNRI